ncbi:MAG: sigma-54-dependent Fis family transcriptional regulator [Candidatus Cloacimonetes bacterium]|nr:sigma-54-dependent Fis family transcriptional regulator [Candidatus Cloacimonadota bacterium]
MEELKILILDDEMGYREGIEEYLLTQGFTVFNAEKPSEGFKVLKEHPCDIVILDIKLPEMNGIHVLKKIKKLYPETEIIMITAHGDMDSVIESLRNGATDFFTKPFRLLNLKTAIERTKRYISLQNRVSDLKAQYNNLVHQIQKADGTMIVGKSKSMTEILNLMKKVASTDNTTILVTGESGTGKEVVARGIHTLSSRKDHTFLDINCSSIPDNLFESEFFGHKKGAFTGAIENKPGYFEVANQGTIFLDEICDMPNHMQTKLLRVLEGNVFRRVGSNRDIKFDVRVISATNKDIDQYVKNNDFREDLLYRLNTFRIHIPPLRDRKDDIKPLLNHFVKILSKKLKKPINKVSNRIYDYLYDYDFPGNVRELRNMVERALIICDNSVLRLEHFAHIIEKPNAKYDSSLSLSILEDQEKEMILKALDKSGNNKTNAAKLLEISRSALNRKIEKYKLQEKL